MCLAKMREAACTMIASARQAGARVIVAGSDASDAPETYLRAGADVALRGEGLDVLPALLRRIETEPARPGSELLAGLEQTVALPQRGNQAG